MIGEKHQPGSVLTVPVVVMVKLSECIPSYRRNFIATLSTSRENLFCTLDLLVGAQRV